MTAIPERMSGVLAPVVTPFDSELLPDRARLAEHCRWLLSQGAGLAVFGTNSEANSMSVEEKIALLDHLVESGIDPERMMPGTGCCALTDTVRLTAHAVAIGCGGTLMLPPFYYKDVSDDGLFASYAEVIERVADDRLRIYLYHIPPVAQVGISTSLIGRLVERYPDTVVGIKDSSGDWNNTAAMLQQEWPDFRVFAGSESFLLQNMRAGGSGCISATANVNPGPIVRLSQKWQAADAEDQQEALNAVRAIVQSYPMIPALKGIVAHFNDLSEWRRVRPPLTALSNAETEELLGRLSATGFTMPGTAAGES